MSKVIILRGNSGSGKSSVAQAIQERTTPRPVLIEHDHFRRKILKEWETPDILNDELMLLAIEFALKHNKDIILEGILPINHSHQKYKDLIDRIVKLNPTHTYIYWFDIPFEETLKRHNSRAKATEFGEEKMRQWYKQDDRTNLPGEVIITKESSLEDTIRLIALQTGLAVEP